MRRISIGLLVAILLVFTSPGLANLKITDYQKRLNSRFSKRLRKTTKFIIIHSTEGSLPSSLRTLSRGKMRRGRYVSRGGHAHYLIARNGSVYRILDPKYRANHAGVSMWNGVTRLSDHSLGIELVGYHNIPFTESQYGSLRKLLEILQKRFQIKDRDVLEHCRVAYARPNRFTNKKRRGRKRDPGINNFERKKADLQDEYIRDPDVVAGRISGRTDLIRSVQKVNSKQGALGDGANERKSSNSSLVEPRSQTRGLSIITTTRTAWKIAGLQYKAATTRYRFPDGTSLRGHEVKDWLALPPGTEVELGIEEVKVVNNDRAEVLLPEVTEKISPWKIANALHNASFTFYIYPSGKIFAGHRISQFSNIPFGTRVLIAYRRMPTPQTKSPLGEDLDDVFLSHRTVYLFPSHLLKSGEQIEDFAQLPQRTVVFTKIE